MPASTEQVLFQYRLQKRLGVGGMGEVFLAHDTVLERSAAIKILSAELAHDEEHRKRFRAEARAASALAHPNICVIYEVGETPEGRPFLAMEYLDGPTLEQLMNRRHLSLNEIVTIGEEVADALAAAHGQGLIHRDIKPSNIIVDRRGHPKVLDFGLAKRQSLSGGSLVTQTQPGALLGTPYYMSPEQALGEDLDPRSDVFSLGVVLYEMASGRKPFPGRSLGETLNQLINKPPDALDLDAPLSALQPIILKCLEKFPEQRYASAGELARDLASLKSQCQQQSSVYPGNPPSTSPAQPRTVVLRGQATPLASATSRRTRRLGLLAAALILVGLIVSGYFLLRPRVPGSPREKSLAVLPFENMSAEADTEYLSDGLTEEITSTLGRVPGLKVAARNSAFALKGKRPSPKQAGKTLHVSTILTGSIRKAGNRLRVSAALVNVADGFQLWSETYERSIDDILTVQEEIARRIADRLRAGSDRPASRKLPSPDVHRTYLQARHFWNQRTEPGLTNAIRLFREVIGKDPSYADAHAGLAAGFLVLPTYAPVCRTQYLSFARTNADTALKLDAECAEAHAVMGQLEWVSRNLARAELHFQQALQFAPNSATAHHWYGQFLTVHGRAKEGLAQLTAAVDLDPLSPIIRTTIPEWYYLTGDTDSAIRESRELILLFPGFPVARLMLAQALIQKDLFKEALAELDQARSLNAGAAPLFMDVTGYALARSGQEAPARAILASYERERANGKSVDLPLALLCVGLRDYDQALVALERLAATDVLEDNIICDPFYKDLRPLPRFQRLLRNSGISP